MRRIDHQLGRCRGRFRRVRVARRPSRPLSDRRDVSSRCVGRRARQRDRRVGQSQQHGTQLSEGVRRQITGENATVERRRFRSGQGSVDVRLAGRHTIPSYRARGEQ